MTKFLEFYCDLASPNCYFAHKALAEFPERISEQAVKDKLRADTEAVVRRGIFGVLTFFVGDEMFFGKDKRADIEALLAS